MQDFNYVWYGCMEVTLELSCCKYPPTSELPKLWEENRLVSIIIYNIMQCARLSVVFIVCRDCGKVLTAV